MSSDMRNTNRENFQKLINLCRFKQVAEGRKKVDHENNKINQMMDWQDKAFKAKYLKKEFLVIQMQVVSTNQLPLEKDQ